MDGTSLVDKESLSKIFRKCFSLKSDEDVNELLDLFGEDPVIISITQYLIFYKVIFHNIWSQVNYIEAFADGEAGTPSQIFKLLSDQDEKAKVGKTINNYYFSGTNPRDKYGRTTQTWRTDIQQIRSPSLIFILVE